MDERPAPQTKPPQQIVRKDGILKTVFVIFKNDAFSGINTISLTSHGVGKQNFQAVNKKLVVDALNVIDGGSGYDQDRATLAITSPDTGGVPATLTPTFTNGVLTSINILSGGSEYKSVKVIDITNRGSGYTTATAAFTAAPAGLTGTFTVPEQVTGGTTGAVAQLVDWNAQEGWIQLKNPTATFSIGDTKLGYYKNWRNEEETWNNILPKLESSIGEKYRYGKSLSELAILDQEDE